MQTPNYYTPEPRFDITLGDYSHDLYEAMSTEDQDAREAEEAMQVAYIQEWSRS